MFWLFILTINTIAVSESKLFLSIAHQTMHSRRKWNQWQWIGYKDFWTSFISAENACLVLHKTNNCESLYSSLTLMEHANEILQKWKHGLNVDNGHKWGNIIEGLMQSPDCKQQVMNSSDRCVKTQNNSFNGLLYLL